MLRERLPAETIFCNGAGNFATWVHRFWPFRRYGTQLAPTSGSMGYGVPAAVGAKRIQPQSPGRRVRRRRRLPHERAGIRHGRAIRPADPGGPARQRHVRHDPHAPGAGISRPRLGHDPEEPGFRRLCHAPSAATASGSSARRSSRRRWSGRWPPESPPSCTACSTRRRSRRRTSLSQIREKALASKA